ncbi:MAG TPA: class I SAM-dependent RNA methyltransferase [Acidobacteriota bacterium]|nr:class I SAM-dependent RNA methyltransferase [Acidobacteriota bacterium]
MDEQVVTIEKMVYGGKGLARLNGQVVFVPFTLPGEKVRIHITKQHRDYLEGEVVEVIEPSQSRIAPACRYFGRCGGCQISHASYDHQVQTKVSVLKETLERNKVTFPEPEVISGTPYEYRHRAQLKYSSRKGQLGFYQTGSNQITDIKECLCLTPGLNRLLTHLRNELLATPIPNLSEIELYENDVGQTAAYFNAKIPSELRERLSNITTVAATDDPDELRLTLRFRNSEFPMHPSIFLQVNPGLWKAMIQEVESHFNNKASSVVAELYCGAGFFTIAIAPHVSKIYASEENRKAVEFAKAQHKNPNISWIQARAEEYKIPNDVTAILVDPPRSGLHKNVINELLRRKPEMITYVSCDPASFARDVRLLGSDYKIDRLLLMDLFAQTYHFETIALLHRK